MNLVHSTRRKYHAVKARLLRPFKPTSICLRHIQYRDMDFVVPLNDSVGWRLWMFGRYEDVQMRYLLSLVEPDDTCVDIGANVGIYSICMAQKATSGRILAFEPISLYRHLIELNAALNELTNIEVHQEVLADRSGTRDLHMCNDGAFSSLRDTGRREVQRIRRVPCTTLTSVDEGIEGSLDIIKIDAEGAELLILKGGSHVLEEGGRRPRACLLEMNEVNQGTFGYRSEDIDKFLTEREYKGFGFTDTRAVEVTSLATPLRQHEEMLYVDANWPGLKAWMKSVEVL